MKEASKLSVCLMLGVNEKAKRRDGHKNTEYLIIMEMQTFCTYCNALYENRFLHTW